ncbi:hypothetical protein DITRI_Ditri13aG0137600 [Diplodiscus trichospermus]
MMESLPEDVIAKILSRLPAASLVRSQLVCRAWRILIQDPFLVNQHYSHMVDRDPGFILETHLNDRYQLYFTDFSDNKERKVVLKEPDNSSSSMVKSLVDSCNGLLCMRDSPTIYIYNPFSTHSMEIPEVHNDSNLQFGFHPTTKEYKLIQVVCPKQWIRKSEVHILTIGSSAGWRNLGIISYRLCLLKPKAMVNGRLHWVCDISKRLVSFDLATEQFQEVPKPANCCDSDKEKCVQLLMVLRGCLSATAYHDNEILEIWVMREYGKKESWVKEFNIGTQTLQQNALQSSKSKARCCNFVVRVLAILKSGEIVLDSSGQLFAYHPHQGTFRELRISGKPYMPWLGKTFAHVGILTWLDAHLKPADK